jgi:hypothetical protein
MGMICKVSTGHMAIFFKGTFVSFGNDELGEFQGVDIFMGFN